MGHDRGALRRRGKEHFKVKPVQPTGVPMQAGKFSGEHADALGNHQLLPQSLAYPQSLGTEQHKPPMHWKSSLRDTIVLFYSYSEYMPSICATVSGKTAQVIFLPYSLKLEQMLLHTCSQNKLTFNTSCYLHTNINR